MMPVILVLNAGSSSVKFSLYALARPVRGLVAASAARADPSQRGVPPGCVCAAPGTGLWQWSLLAVVSPGSGLWHCPRGSTTLQDGADAAAVMSAREQKQG